MLKSRGVWAGLLAVGLGGLAAGCSDELGMEDRGIESPEPELGPADSFNTPTLHYPFVPGTKTTASLSASHRFHAFRFRLDKPAYISANTDPTGVSGAKSLDTVMYLYSVDLSRVLGANPYELIEKNDNAQQQDIRFPWSRMGRRLEPGLYQYVVKGYSTSLRGKFAFNTTCDGPGCQSAQVCDFGQAWHDIFASSEYPEQTPFPASQRPKFRINSVRTVRLRDMTSSTRAPQLVAAVKLSAPSVTNLNEAFAAVEGFQVEMFDLADRRTSRNYVAYRFHRGDTPVGAIFLDNTFNPSAAPDLYPLARVSDDDLLDCGLRAGGELSTYWFESRRANLPYSGESR